MFCPIMLEGTKQVCGLYAAYQIDGTVICKDHATALSLKPIMTFDATVGFTPTELALFPLLGAERHND